MNQVWYDDELGKIKRKMCRKDRIWRKYCAQHQWKDFCEDCNYYFKQLYVKKHYIKSEIHKLRNNSRELYKIVLKLTGSAVDNAMPEHESNKLSVHKFVEFSMNKIKMISKI